MATVPPSEQREVWDCEIDDSALAALDIDAAIAASARDAEAHAALSEDDVLELRGELRRAQDRVEELTSLLSLYSPPPATIRRHQRSPASRLQERVPLTASLLTNRSPTIRLKKAWCVAHTGDSQLRDENSSSRTARSPCTRPATSPAVTTKHSAASSQTSPQGASPNIRVPRTKMLQLHSEFACAICYELYMEPVTTPCGHSYCRCCLAKSLQRVGRNCPQCRTRIPSGTVLQPNTALASDELASRPEPMCSPVVTVADRIASGALRRGRTRESQRQGTSTRAHSPTDDDMQLALAMSLSVAHPSNAAIPRASHSSRGSYVREEVIDLRSDDEADDAGVGEATASLDLDLDIDARHNPAWSPTVAATQQTGYSRVQRRAASNSISDATIERLTGLRLA